MNPNIKYALKLESDKSLIFAGSRKIIFLCGVIFDGNSDEDKRTVLKKYLLENPVNHPLILEEHFSNLNLYNQINIHNLYDVETLVACFANATIIIHESISTGSELGMLAANKSTASKLLVLHPDRDSIEENKVSTFMYLAYYGGKRPVLDKKWMVPFYPAIRRGYDSNDRYTYHTIFPDNLTDKSYARDAIDSFLLSPSVQLLRSVKFVKPQYNTPSVEHADVIDYYIKEEGAGQGAAKTLYMHISPMALRELLFGVVSIKSVQKRIEASISISEVMSILEEELANLLTATSTQELGMEVSKIIIKLKCINLSTFQDETTDHLRKAIGLFIYLLKTMDYLSIEDNLRFKFRRNFNATEAQYSQIVVPVVKSAFKEYMEQEK